MTDAKKKKMLTAGDTTFYQFDAQMGFWGIPNLEREVSYDVRPEDSFLVKHNKDGNRDSDTGLEINEKSIVCLGGSHTWGSGVQQELCYTERLADRTGRRVINMGHCSLGLDQVCLAILQKVGKYRPDVIIVEQYPWAVHRVLNNYVNGYVRPYFYLDSRQELRLQKVSSLAKYKIFRKMIGSYYSFRKEFREYQSGIELKQGYDPLADPIFLYWKARQYDSMYCLIDKILSVMRDHCRQNGIKLLFGLGAIQQQFGERSQSELVDYDLPRNRLIELLEKNKIAYVDMTAKMIESHSEQDPVIFADGHINTKGHDVFAQVLYDSLLGKGWLSR
jgi:hypothetical protein